MLVEPGRVRPLLNESEESLDEIQKQVEEFLRGELPESWVVAIDEGDAERLTRARDELDLGIWWVRLADAGYVAPTWPQEYGGLGFSPAQAASVSRILRRYKVPRFTNPVGVDMVGPADSSLGYG